MRKFRFAGDALLRLRQNRLDRIAAQVATVESRRSLRARQLTQLQDTVGALLGNVSTGETLMGANLRALEIHRNHLNAEIRNCAAQEKNDARTLITLRADLALARRQARLLERLKERRLGEHLAEQERHDEDELEEIAILRWNARTSDR